MDTRRSRGPYGPPFAGASASILMFFRRLITYVFVAALAAPALAQGQAGHSSTEAWRQKYEADLRADYGWLSVAGLTFLERGVSTIGSLSGSDIRLPAGHAPLEVGRLVTTDVGVTLHLKPGVDALLNGKPAPRVVRLRKAQRGTPDVPGTPADRVRVGAVEFHLHESGPRLAVRVRDPQSPIRLGFDGTRWFPVAGSARVTATLRRLAVPREVPVANILGDIEPYDSPGTLELTLDGQAISLLAFTATKGRLQVIFRDATAGRETYGTRYVYAEPVPGGRYVIDFNRAYNPPCAYNPYTTCPTPPAENILTIPVRAGEKLPDGPGRSTSTQLGPRS